MTSAVEHKAVLLPCQRLQEEGYELIVLPVDGQGRVSIDEAEAAINDQTLLVSVQAANNEVVPFSLSRGLRRSLTSMAPSSTVTRPRR